MRHWSCRGTVCDEHYRSGRRGTSHQSNMRSTTSNTGYMQRAVKGGFQETRAFVDNEALLRDLLFPDAKPSDTKCA